MEIGISRDEASILLVGIEFMAKTGVLKDVLDCFPNNDLECVIRQLRFVEQIED